MQLGKILAAGTMGLLMAGSTVAFAATLADFPHPFVSDEGAAEFLVVVGAAAHPQDVVGAIDVATRLGSETYTTFNCPSSAGTTTVSGEGASMATANMKIYLNDNLMKTGLRYTFTAAEMPTVLGSGTLADTTNSDSYDFNQYIDLHDNYTIQFAQYVPDSGVNEDPALLLREGTASTTTVTPENYLYKMKIVFEKEVNGTSTASEKLNIFGQEYTIASTTTFAPGSEKLVLYGSSNTKVLTGGITETVTVDDTEYEVTLQGVPDADTVVIAVGSAQRSVDQGQTTTIGGLQVYVDEVYWYGSTRTDNQAKISFGSEKLTFENNTEIYTTSGTTDTYIDGTKAVLTASGSKLSMIEVYIVGTSVTADVLKEGGSFVDPIFGTFSLDFDSASPTLMSEDKSSLELTTSGNEQLQATFTPYTGSPVTMTWANDADSIDLADASNKEYHVLEGEPVELNEYMVVDSGGFSHIFKLSKLNNNGRTTGSINLYDVLTGTTYNVLMGTDNMSTKVIDGQTYYINGTVGTSYVQIHWGTSSGQATTGAETTIWPIIPGIKGEKYAFAKNPTHLNVTNGKYYILPTGVVLATKWNQGGSVLLNLTAYTGYNVGTAGFSNFNLSSTANTQALYLGKTATGGSYYNITAVTGDNGSMQIKPAGSTAVAFTEDAMVLVEEQDYDTNVHSVWLQASNETVSGSVVMNAAAPDFTYASVDSAGLVSNTDKTQYVDLFGVFAERTVTGQDTVKVWYPDDQVTMNFFVLGTGAAVAAQSGAAGGAIKQVDAVATPVAKLDSEVTTADQTNKNIVLVGGPAVNTLVAELAAAGKTKDADWYRSEGEGTAIIDLVEDAWGTEKAALVVAGNSKEDTKTVTGILLDYESYADDLTGVFVMFKDGVISTEAATTTTTEAEATTTTEEVTTTTA